MYSDTRNVEYEKYNNTGNNFSQRRLKIQKLKFTF